jgi:hypothetical protein
MAGQYYGNILVDPLLMLPTNSKELAILLDTKSHDWGECLLFLNNVAKSRGIIINMSEVAEEVAKLQGEANE